MGHLLSLTKRESGSGFPFDVPVIRALERLDLDAPVCFFVGENGSGKSTLLEAIALAARLPTIGSEDAASDDTLAAQRGLAQALRLAWRRKATRGFFLRAEDFFGYVKRQAQLRSELVERAAQIEREYVDRSPLAKQLALGPALGSVRDMDRRYGSNLDENSHGQSFLRLFQARFVPDGLFLLDEPEAPLSPQSQLALLLMMGEMVGHGGQFIIATHSPILLAYPGARIYSFDGGRISAVEYDSLDHVTLTRDFLNAPERYLRQLKA
jgi:predicted ATPase